MMSNKFTNRNQEEVGCTNLKRIKHTNLKSVPTTKLIQHKIKTD